MPAVYNKLSNEHESPAALEAAVGLKEAASYAHLHQDSARGGGESRSWGGAETRASQQHHPHHPPKQPHQQPMLRLRDRGGGEASSTLLLPRPPAFANSNNGDRGANGCAAQGSDGDCVQLLLQRNGRKAVVLVDGGGGTGGGGARAVLEHSMANRSPAISPHTAIGYRCVLLLLCVSSCVNPHTTIYLSSYYCMRH